MKFLGIEISGIAGYTKQFISIGNSINLIAGRNNIGKTAMLNAVTVLRNLPVGAQTETQVPFEVREYSSMGGGFDFSIRFLIDSMQAPTLDNQPEVWQQTVASQKARLAYNFHVHPAGWVLLDSVVAHIDELELLVIEPALDSGRYTRYWHNTQSGTVERTLDAGVGGMVLPDGRIVGTYPQDDLFGHLVPLKELVFISGHRVFKDFQALRTVNVLGPDAEDLGLFLQWLQGARPRQFNQIQQFLTQIFPEFEYINIENVTNNQVTIRLTKTNSDQKIQLSRCGTGVEQLLALATFVISSAAGNLICVDEPHSFLHPAAERLLLEFLRKHREHCYLITTHSAIFINSVPATGITYLSGEGAGIDDRRSHATAQLLFDLGYKNSDLLFADRVIFVEGETDKQVLPILLEKAGLDPSVLATTAICKLKGSGDLHTITRQSEDLLTALYKDTILRVYLFDGDKRPKKDYMQKIKNVRTGQEIPVAFLSRTEIEDYLLDPYAIAAAMAEEKNADQNGSEQVAYSPDQVNSWLREAAAKLGSSAKGSEILSHVYDQASFRYKKTEHGRLIGLRTSLETNPALLELLEPLRFVLTTALLSGPKESVN